MLQRISKRWTGFCIVAAPGPSLTEDVAQACKGFPVVAVNDAWRRIPWAEVLYACDRSWWDYHQGCPGFVGEKWSSHGNAMHDNKLDVAERFGINLVAGKDEEGFSLDPALIHYGSNSGFQAVNVALHLLGRPRRGRIALVGFDMRMVDGKRHFFGEHPPGLRQTQDGYQKWPLKFARAAEMLPFGIEIVNCTPGSALTCFKAMDLRDALPAVAER